MTEPALDPVTFEVIWHRLLDATEEMGIKYMRTSGSPVLVGAYDAATAITLPDGELVAMGPFITTQGHVIRLLIEATIRLRGDVPGIHDGDMWIVNDPYLGATHQPDVATLAPVHHDGELAAWVGSSGHWLDIGGPEPGGFNMNARAVFDEGLRMPPLRLMRNREVQQDVVDLIMDNVREPLVELDLRGQMVANQAGQERLAALFSEFGPRLVERVMRQGIDYVERRFRARLRELPDGVWRQVQYLDHDGHERNLRAIVCTMTKTGDHLTLDFSGSAPEVAGFANCAFGGLRAAVLSGLCITLGYDLTWNDGIARGVDIIAPPGTIVSAQHPTPVSMSTISTIIVTLNLVLVTASRMLLSSPRHHEEAMAGWCGTSIGYSLAGINDRGIFSVCAEASHFAAGCGARVYADGVDTGGIIINTTANIPSVEATESEYPVLYLFRKQLTDSGGPGRYRGGMSAGVALMAHGARSELESSFAAVGAEVPNGYGIAGGLPGATVRLLRFVGGGSTEDLTSLPVDENDIPGRRVVMTSNLSREPLSRDSVEYHNWQGGGGYGDPIDRDPISVLSDVRAGAVSRDAAERVYGVVMTPDGVDQHRTYRRRDEIKSGRVERAKPASELLTHDEDEWHSLILSMDRSRSHGRLRYGDLFELDFENDRLTCLRCGRILGRAVGDPLRACLVEEVPVWQHAIGWGADYSHEHGVMLRFYYCHCGVQVEAEVTVPGSKRSGFVIAGASPHQ
jgi:N-methylhydantoinase B